MATQQILRFLRNTTDLGIIAAGASARVNLKTIQAQFGRNLNTVVIKNNTTEEISVSIDGQTIIFISKGDAFSLDWRDNIIFSDVEITNEDGANATSANEIRISVGRTGPDEAVARIAEAG